MVKITFVLKDGKNTLDIENSSTIENMLREFLKKTNSRFTLDTDKIVFMYKSKILNINPNLKKTVGEMFNRSEVVSIMVSEVEPIIGSGY